MLTQLLAATAIAAAAPGPHAHAHTHAGHEINEMQGPVLLETTYTGEVMSVADGGLRRGTRYLDNLDIVLEADLEALTGWRGAELHVYGLYNNGKSISDLAGDAQAVSNIETGKRKLRLYEAWIDQTFGEHVSLKAGRYDLNSEFDSLETAALFVGSAHGIGTDIAQTGLNGPSIFPETSLAARLEVKSAKGWALRTAILDGAPGIGGDQGALLIGEAEAPVLGGRLLLGHWRYGAFRRPRRRTAARQCRRLSARRSTDRLRPHR